MKLLTKTIRKQFPEWMSTDGKDPSETRVIVKFFDPCGSWTWYATEFDGEDTFFGLVDGWEKELGYFSLTELELVRGSLGLGIERDIHFGKHTLDEFTKSEGSA
jgi:hypothetical protein